MAQEQKYMDDEQSEPLLNERHLTANYSDDIVNGKQGCCDSACGKCLSAIFWYIPFGTIIMTLCLVIYLPILIVMILIPLLCVAPCRCCSTNLDRQIKLSGSFGAWVVLFVRNNYECVWRSMTVIPIFKDFLNSFYTALLLNTYTKMISRLPKYTMKHDYVTLDLLYDEAKTTYARVLPKVSQERVDALPPIDDCVDLFVRKKFTPETNSRLSVMIPYWAQWFSHQFFSTNSEDPTKLNQPVGVYLGQLYGTTIEVQTRLRLFKGGLMKSSWINAEEFPPIIDMPNDGGKKTAYSFLQKGKQKFDLPIGLFSMIPGCMAVHTIFFRHHQYVARTLYKYYGDTMDDEQIYQTAKMIVILTSVKVTMEDYVVNALQTSHVKVHFDLNVMDTFAYKCFGPSDKDFVPCNSVQTEFNFLYRQHQYYPDRVPLDETDNEYLEFPLNDDWNAVMQFQKKGRLEEILSAATHVSAGKVSLLNTNEFLAKHVVKKGLETTRKTRVAGYNDYRERFNYQRIERFEDMNDNEEIVNALKSVYKSVDDIEYYVGIWAEKKEFGGIHGPFLADMGIGFTYTGIFASRLWRSDRVNKESLTPVGLKLIEDIGGINDIAHLHTNLNKRTIAFRVPK